MVPIASSSSTATATAAKSHSSSSSSSMFTSSSSSSFMASSSSPTQMATSSFAGSNVVNINTSTVSLFIPSTGGSLSSLLTSSLFLMGILPLLLLLLVSPNVQADSTALFPGQNEWEEHRICGRLLINALKTVCNHQYAQPTRDQLYDNYYKSTGMIFRARRGSASTASLIGGASRKRRGIIWECCTNKCSLNYIRNNYCAQGPNEGNDAGAAAAAGNPMANWQFVEEVSKKKRRRR